MFVLDTIFALAIEVLKHLSYIRNLIQHISPLFKFVGSTVQLIWDL